MLGETIKRVLEAASRHARALTASPSLSPRRPGALLVLVALIALAGTAPALGEGITNAGEICATAGIPNRAR